ncbi:hypothetical protein AB0L75_00630 [Streptomyces sp. NPDC052101]
MSAQYYLAYDYPALSVFWSRLAARGGAPSQSRPAGARDER